MTRVLLAVILLAFTVPTPRTAPQPIPARPSVPAFVGRAEPDPAGPFEAPVRSTATQPAKTGASLAKEWARAVLGARQYRCLAAIVQYESRWRLHARNARTGAFGWFQAYPASKLDRYGRDAMGQMRFGLAYVKARYGTACAGLAHIREVGWW